ncbi:MAG: DNA mismatch repair endonuclease MutL [Kofleriaceae bacterium]
MISTPEPVIAVLPEHVIDQIAAGEVIERPASVVKELVDNAIDSRARAIVIEITGGGRGVVRVSDDGCGMSAGDAVLAFERHATSKLRTVDDLWGLVSMGFRGEALPSIASVSRMSLTTRRHSDMVATRVEIEGGRLVGVSEVGAPVGTTVEVMDLLYNVPARLKFLKGDATEASHITDLVAKFAMAHPQLHLRLRHNGRTALELPPERDGFARAQSLLGPRVASLMMAASGGEDGIQVAAYLGAPELAQTTTRGVQIFVGRRAVRDRGLLHAITMGYGELVPRGRYPVAVVLVEVPAGAVDVNVHPQKIEVRFADAAAVATAVRHVVQTRIAASAWREGGAGGASMMTAISSSAPPALPFDGHAATPLAQRYARELRRGQATLGLDSRSSASSRAWVADIKRSTRDMDAGDRVVAAYMRSREDLPDRPATSAAEPAAPTMFPEGSAPTAVANSYFAKLRYLGQLDLTYLVCEADGELVLVDQHAAHERVELARLIARHTKQEPAVQKLLFPVTIEVTPQQLELVGRVGALLAGLGFEAEAFGKSTLAIKAVPSGIRHGDPAQLLRKLLDEWNRDGAPTDAERMTRVLAEIACHSVVRAGDRLAAGEAEVLLRSLDTIEHEAPESAGRFAAGHGRALLLRMPLQEIGRRFGR